MPLALTYRVFCGTGKILVMNLIYDLTCFCTSIVADSPDGSMLHARNLDYGIPGLRNLTIALDFQKNKKTVYRGVTFAGYVGLLTGLR